LNKEAGQAAGRTENGAKTEPVDLNPDRRANNKSAALKRYRKSQTRSARQKTNQGAEAERSEQIYLLETKLRKSANLQVTLSLSSLSVVMLFLLQTFLPQSGSYAVYFLIGNGVMGAIIMCHLIEAISLGKTFRENR
jgi:hypothetical protein